MMYGLASMGSMERSCARGTVAMPPSASTFAMDFMPKLSVAPSFFEMKPFFRLRGPRAPVGRRDAGISDTKRDAIPFQSQLLVTVKTRKLQLRPEDVFG